MTRLFKFRSLENDVSFKYTKPIVEKGMFYCNKLWNLNDPMEGIFRFGSGPFTREQLRRVFSRKNEFLLCSFSGIYGFKKPTMWGYYAGGFKGVAIEVDASEEFRLRQIHKIQYETNVAELKFDQHLEEATRAVLTTKLRSWEIENEYRFLHRESRAQPKEISIGKVIALHFGCPFDDVLNDHHIQRECEALSKYIERQKVLIAIAKERGIPCFAARIKGHEVVSEPLV